MMSIESFYRIRRKFFTYHTTGWFLISNMEPSNKLEIPTSPNIFESSPTRPKVLDCHEIDTHINNDNDIPSSPNNVESLPKRPNVLDHPELDSKLPPKSNSPIRWAISESHTSPQVQMEKITRLPSTYGQRLVLCTLTGK